MEEQSEKKKLWFKAEEHGWGWVPSSPEGWAAVAIFLLFAFADFRFIYASRSSISSTLVNFFPRLIFLALVLIAVCYVKGEKPKWRSDSGNFSGSVSMSDEK